MSLQFEVNWMPSLLNYKKIFVHTHIHTHILYIRTPSQSLYRAHLLTQVINGERGVMKIAS